MYERVKFLQIFASNLDEFFQVRVSGLRRQRLSGQQALAPDGLTPVEQLDRIRQRVLELVVEQSAVYARVKTQLAREQIEIVAYGTAVIVEPGTEPAATE